MTQPQLGFTGEQYRNWLDRIDQQPFKNSEWIRLAQLWKPWPSQFVETKPKSGNSPANEYVSHILITQKVLQVFGFYDQEVIEVLKGPVNGVPARGQKKAKPPLPMAVTGVVLRVKIGFEPGRGWSIDEAGACEHPHNDQYSMGEQLKKAISDAHKRALMRVGAATEMWCKKNSHYLLPGFIPDYALMVRAGEGAVAAEVAALKEAADQVVEDNANAINNSEEQ